MVEILFSEKGFEDYLYWQSEDKKVLQKINKDFFSSPTYYTTRPQCCQLKKNHPPRGSTIK